MKVRLNVVLNASDDYTCGNCKKCPIHQEGHLSTYQYEKVEIRCPLGYNSVSCPLEPQTESKVEELKQKSCTEIKESEEREI